MKLGFLLRRLSTEIMLIIRRMINLAYYLFWLVIDPSKFRIIRPNKIKSLLVIYGGATGDTYNLLGILNQLTIMYPKLNIFYLSHEKNKQFVKNPKIKLINIIQARDLINARKIQAVAILENSHFLKKLYFNLLKVPYRIGCDFLSPSLIFQQPPALLTRKLFPYYHTGIKDWLNVFRTLGFKIEDEPKFYFTKQGELEANKFLNEHNISKQEKLIFLHSGAGTISKALKENKVPSHEWPIQNWISLANQLITHHNARLIFTGSYAEKHYINKIIKGIIHKRKVIDSSGNLSIETLASLMKKGSLLISIDTSLAHIGAQAGIPVIDLFGPYPPKLASPWTDKKTILFHPEVCNSCRGYACPEQNQICMKAITPKEVLNAAKRFLI